MKPFVVWYSTSFSVVTGIFYLLAGAGVLSTGLELRYDEAPPAIFYVAAGFYALVAYLVHIEKRWLQLTLGIINALVILIFVQMWMGEPAVLTSSAGLGTKIGQGLLEIGLIYLIIKTWNQKVTASTPESE